MERGAGTLLAAGRALTITIIYARGTLTLTFNVPLPTVKATPGPIGHGLRFAEELLPLLEKLILGAGSGPLTAPPRWQ